MGQIPIVGLRVPGSRIRLPEEGLGGKRLRVVVEEEVAEGGRTRSVQRRCLRGSLAVVGLGARLVVEVRHSLSWKY